MRMEVSGYAIIYLEKNSGDMMRKLMGSVDSANDCATKEPSLGHPPGGGSFGQYGVLPQK